MSWKKALERLAARARNPVAMTHPVEEPGFAWWEGIYVCKWQPKNVSQVFNVFAAPENLPGEMTYDELVGHVSGLKNWHGFDGAPFRDDAALYVALRDGSYNGGWVIPPVEILHGRESKLDEMVLPDNIFSLQDKGAFAGKTSFTYVDGHAKWYWSSTKCHDDTMLVVSVSANHAVSYSAWGPVDTEAHSCRPVRFVKVAP